MTLAVDWPHDPGDSGSDRPRPWPHDPGENVDPWPMSLATDKQAAVERVRSALSRWRSPFPRSAASGTLLVADGR